MESHVSCKKTGIEGSDLVRSHRNAAAANGEEVVRFVKFDYAVNVTGIGPRDEQLRQLLGISGGPTDFSVHAGLSSVAQSLASGFNAVAFK